MTQHRESISSMWESPAGSNDYGSVLVCFWDGLHEATPLRVLSDNRMLPVRGLLL